MPVGEKAQKIEPENGKNVVLTIDYYMQHVLCGELENMMNTNHTFLSKDYERLMQKFKGLTEEKVALLEKRKERHYKAIEVIDALVKEIR